MKLVYLASATLPSQGADAVHVMSVCKAFAENGCEVTLIARKSDMNIDPFEFYGIDKGLFKLVLVNRPDIRILGGFIYGYNVRKAYRSLPKPDFIYARSMHGLFTVNPKKIPFFFESHWIPDNMVYHQYQKKFLNSKNLVSFIFISDALKSMYEKVFPNFKYKFNVLHDACNYPPKIEEIQNNRLQVGYVGSFFKGNGYEIIPLMAERLPDYDFHIVGGKEPQLTELKKKYNLPNMFFYGHIPHGQLPEKYALFDVMLAPYQKDVPSLDWMSPMKLFEYMSYSKAIVASDFPVIREVLNESNSILVEADILDKWIEAVAKMNDKVLRERLGKRAFTDFELNYTWNKRVNEIINLFKKHEKNTKNN